MPSYSISGPATFFVFTHRGRKKSRTWLSSMPPWGYPSHHDMYGTIAQRPKSYHTMCQHIAARAKKLPSVSHTKSLVQTKMPLFQQVEGAIARMSNLVDLTGLFTAFFS